MALTVETYDGLAEAARAVAASRTARFLGGGTLIMRAVNEGDQTFDTIVRARDPALRSVETRSERITIGAGVTMSEVMRHRDLAFLAPAARVVGGPAVRSMASVGGNLFAASPYGDFATALLALDARVHLASPGSGDGVPLQEFLAGRDREPRPVVAAVSLPRPRDPRAFRFLKVSRVKPKGVSVLSIAAYLPQSGGRVAGARVAYGAMGPVPLRAPAVERALEGAALDEAGVAAAVAAAAEGLDPPTDPVASAWYRRAVAPVHLKRLLLNRAS